MKTEIWVKLKYNGIIYNDYEVSNTGKIRSLDRVVSCNRGFRKVEGRELVPRNNGKCPHLFVDVIRYENGIRRRLSIYVHRAVGISFVSNPQNKRYVSHLNEDFTNNTSDNLVWITHSELQISNMKKNPELRNRLRDRNIKSGYYTKNSQHKKLSSEKIKQIKEMSQQGINVNYIVVMLGVSKSSVYKYR